MMFSKPIAMPRGTHYGNNYWEVYSYKLKRIVCLFSNLEYENFLTLEMDPLVETYCEQPLEVELHLDDKSVKTIFDFWVKYKNGSEQLQEIKYSKELYGNDKAALRTQEQIRRQKLWCKENNIDYVIRTEKTIHSGEFTIRNFNIMAANVRRYTILQNNYNEKQLVEHLKNTKSTIKELLESNILPVNQEIQFLCFMYYKGIITLNINNRPIDYSTEVSLWLKKNII